MIAYCLFALFASLCFGAQLPVVPGTQFVGCGVNLTNLQLGLGNVIDLTSFTFGPSNDWENPITGQYYRVPDMMVAQWNSVSNFSTTTSTFQSITDFQIWTEHHYSWHSGIFGMVSHSKTTYNYLERRWSMDQTMSLSTLEMSFLDLTIPDFPPPNLAPVFQAALNELPVTCCDDPNDYQMYLEFFASFGHGWMSEATMGGRLWYESWMPYCFLNVTSVSWVTEQSGWSFLGIIGNGHGSVSNNSNINPSFQACLTEQYIFEGGSQFFQNPSFYSLWAPTIYENPVPLTFTVSPYSTLISNTAQAAAMDTATAKALNEAQGRMEAYQASLAQNDPHLHPACCNQVGEAFKKEQEKKEKSKK